MSLLSKNLNRLKAGIRSGLRLRRGHQPQNGAADVQIISYPKTGRTWLRMMIGQYLCSRGSLDESRILDTPYLSAQNSVRVTEFSHDGSNLRKMISWRTQPDSKAVYRNKRVLLLTRNVEDTMVSAWFQVSRRLGIYSGSLSEMLRDERFGVQKFIAFYRSWYLQQHVPRQFAEVSYEDLHSDPVGVLSRVLAFIGEDEADEHLVRRSVEYSSFENMRRIEQSQVLSQHAMRAADPKDVNSHKVRRGVVGGFADYLSDQDAAFIRKLALAADCPFVRTASSAPAADITSPAETSD